MKPGQDFEVIIDFQPNQTLDLDRFYNDLAKIGTSIQVGEGDGIYRLHIHVATEKRYKPIDYAMSIGNVTSVAMENLIEQVQNKNHTLASSTPPYNLASVVPGQTSVVVVSPGQGIRGYLPV